MIHIYCGDGKGKTSAATGLALRMAGYGKKILFIQFLKGSYTGELEIFKEIKNIKIMRCDREYGFTEEMTDKDKSEIIKCHNQNLMYALENMNAFDMIVLDEICAACNYRLAEKDTVITLMERYSGELVLTGRGPDKLFAEKADYISEIKKIKHPFDKGIIGREGIEY